MSYAPPEPPPIVTFVCSVPACRWKERSEPAGQAVGVKCPGCGVQHRLVNGKWVAS